MTSARKNKNRNSRQTPAETSTKRNSIRSIPLITSVNTPSTASATPVQQASLVDQSSDLPTLPNKNNASLEEQFKQQQLLIDKITNRINTLESHVQLLEGKIAIQEKRRFDILQQVQHIIKGESSDDSPNEGEGTVKFAFEDVYGTLKIVLSKRYKNRHIFAFDSILEYFQIVNKVSTRRRYPYESEFED